MKHIFFTLIASLFCSFAWSQSNCIPSYTYTSAGNNVIFTNTSTGASINTVYYWIFGDGTNGTGINATHAYSNSGTYTACLVMYTPLGCTDSFCTTVTLSNAPTCNATINANSSGCTGNFINASTGTGSSTTQWYWGDGTSGINNNTAVQHTYATSGVYTVLAVVSYGTNGAITCVDSAYTVVTIACPPPGTGCTATFTSIANGPTGIFTGTTTSTCGAGTYYWIYGDGTTGTGGPTNLHTYTLSGTYNVCMVYTDTCGCVDSFCTPIIINLGTGSTCNAAFSATSTGCTGNFISTSTGTGTVSYNWYFGDGTSIVTSLAGASHTYTTGGTYNVMLIASYSNLGTICVDSAIVPITIVCGTLLPCNASFTYVTSGNTAVFNNTSTGGPTNGVSYTYYFGDGTTSNGNTTITTHNYALPGTYNVCLVMVSNNILYPCIDSFCSVVTILGNNTNCTAAFMYSVNGCVVNFIDTSIGNYQVGAFSYGNGTFGAALPTGNSVTYLANGVYVVCLAILDTVGNCSDTLCLPITINNCGTAIHNVLPSINVVLSPNPFSNNIIVQLDNSNTTNIKLLNTVGMVVYNKVYNSNTINLNTQALPNGVYLLLVEDKQGRTFKKAILKQ